MKEISKNEKFSPDTRIKMLELFGGIGAPKQALKNLGIESKTIDYVDTLNWATIAWNKLHSKDNEFKQNSVVDWNIDIDILFHGSPCQDFSIAGQQKGGVEGTGTRSSLLWETINIVKNGLNKKPKVIIWENVKGVLFEKNKPVFDDYINTLKDIGYESTYKLLNSKDFGIPQSRPRVFVVSILKGEEVDWLNYDFDFENLETKEAPKLKDFLEPQETIDDWYYIKHPSMVNAIEKGNVRVIDEDELIINPKQNVMVALKWNGEKFIQDYTMEIQDSGNYFIIPRDKDGELIGGSYNRYWKEEEISGTISTGNGKDQIKIAQEIVIPKEGVPIYKIGDKHYHLRMLTERECWRLQGFKDEDIDRVFDTPIPKVGLYHLAGNSITVPVIEAIYKELFK